MLDRAEVVAGRVVDAIAKHLVRVIDRFAGIGGRDESPRVPCDLEDHERDKQADDRVCAWKSDSDESGAHDDAERHEPVSSSVVPIGDERGTRESSSRSKSNLRRKLVTCQSDQPRRCEHPQVRYVLWVDEPLNRLVQRDTRGHEDREYHRESCEFLAAEAPEVERDSERDRSQCVSEVVHDVGEQRDRGGQREDRKLRAGRKTEDSETECDRLDSLARPNDGAVDEAMRVAMQAVMLVVPV